MQSLVSDVRVTSLTEGGGRSQALISYTLEQSRAPIAVFCMLGWFSTALPAPFAATKRLDLIKHLFVTHSVEPNFYFVALTAALTRSSWALHSIRLSHTRVGSIPIGRNS